MRFHTLMLEDLMFDNTMLFAGPLFKCECVRPACARRSHGRGVFQCLTLILRVTVVLFVSKCSVQIFYQGCVVLPIFGRMIKFHSLVERDDFISHPMRY